MKFCKKRRFSFQQSISFVLVFVTVFLLTSCSIKNPLDSIEGASPTQISEIQSLLSKYGISAISCEPAPFEQTGNEVADVVLNSLSNYLAAYTITDKDGAVYRLLLHKENFAVVSIANPNTKEIIYSAIPNLLSGENARSEDLSPQNPFKADPSSGNSSVKQEVSNGWYGDGMYKVGEDLEPGIYYFEASSQFSGYYSISANSNGGLDSIVSNDNVATFSFIEVQSGQYLEISRGRITQAKNIKSIEPKDGIYEEGMYRVGIDIPSGEYNIQSKNGMGYMAILSDASGSIDSIITNDNFTNNKYVTVTEGQYLKIVRAYIKAV